MRKSNLASVRDFFRFPRVSSPEIPQITRRDQDIQLFGNSSSDTYFIQLYIGTPQQAVKLIVDPGSFQMWVSPACDAPSPDADCNSNGHYDPANSTTSNDTHTSSSITYGDGSTADLNYYTDTIALSTGLQISNVQFGVSTNKTGFTSGILGLGYGESASNTDYFNFVDQLASQRITNSKAFSLALGNTTTANSGVIIFGGIDTKKFSGSLASNDIISSDLGYTSYTIPLAGVGSGTWGGPTTNISNSNATVLLDSGTTITYLPTTVINGLAKAFNATNDETLGGYAVPCSVMENQNSFVAFNFAGVIIQVPFSGLAIPADGDTCFWGIQDDSNIGSGILGLNFLRNAYVVFDQTLNTISLAQFVDCGQNEQELPTSGASGFTGQCSSGVSTTPGSPMPTPTGSSTGSGSSAGLSSGAKAGIGAGVAIGALLAAGIAYFIIASRRRRQGADAAEPVQEHLPDGTNTVDPAYKEQPYYVPEMSSEPVYHEMDGAPQHTAELPGTSQWIELDSNGRHGYRHTQPL
ncbi:aspartic peptidase domain-containing protein [Xylariaceae sp. FL0255]|nr:aspartic peptidase domain-containing protein [Xylariaceae sp. FL0255]